MDLHNTTLMEEDNATNTTNGELFYPVNGPAIIIVCVFITLFILGANIFALVFLFTVKDRKLRNRISMILNLTYSDIIIGIVAFMLIFKLCKESLFADYACWFFMFLLEFGLAASLFQTFCICLERYLAVQGISVLKSLFGERRGRNILLIVSWVVIGVFFGCLKIFSPTHIELCTYPNLYGQYYDKILKITMFGVYTPLLLGTIILYLLTLIKLTSIIRKRKKSTRNNPISSKNVKKSGQDTTRKQKESYETKTYQMVETHRQQINHDKKAQVDQKKKSSSGETTETKYIDGQRCSKSSFTSGSSIDIGHLETQQRKNQGAPESEKLESQVFLKTTKIQTQAVKNKHLSTPGIKFKIKAIKTVGLIVLALTLSTGTGIVLLIVETMCSNCRIDKQIRTFTTMTWFLNSSINPLIYIFAIKEFRESVKKLFNLKCLYK